MSIRVDFARVVNGDKVVFSDLSQCGQAQRSLALNVLVVLEIAPRRVPFGLELVDLSLHVRAAILVVGVLPVDVSVLVETKHAAAFEAAACAV